MWAAHMYIHMAFIHSEATAGIRGRPLLSSIYREQTACNSPLLHNTPVMNTRAGDGGSPSHSVTCVQRVPVDRVPD